MAKVTYNVQNSFSGKFTSFVGPTFRTLADAERFARTQTVVSQNGGDAIQWQIIERTERVVSAGSRITEKNADVIKRHAA